MNVEGRFVRKGARDIKISSYAEHVPGTWLFTWIRWLVLPVSKGWNTICFNFLWIDFPPKNQSRALEKLVF